MFILRSNSGLERLGHEVVFLDFVGTDFEAGREAMLRAFDQVITRWWHPRQTALVVTPTLETLYRNDSGQIARFADAAAAVITLSAPFRREPPEPVVHVRPRILFESDPAYTHLSVVKRCCNMFGGADLYFTVGGNIGSPAVLIAHLRYSMAARVAPNRS